MQFARNYLTYNFKSPQKVTISQTLYSFNICAQRGTSVTRAEQNGNCFSDSPKPNRNSDILIGPSPKTFTSLPLGTLAPTRHHIGLRPTLAIF